MDESTKQPGLAGEPAAPAQSVQSAPATQASEVALGLHETAPAPEIRKRSVWLIGGLGLLVIVLAAAAYVGGQLINRAPGGRAGGPSSGPKMMIGKRGGETRSFSIEPAKELPQSNPDMRGVLVRRQDNSLFVGTGKVQRIVQKEGKPNAQAPAPTYDGPVLEAVVTHDTQIYRDETDFAAPPSAQSGTIQQVIKPGSLDDLSANSLVQVWGEKTGNRIVARILVYQPG